MKARATHFARDPRSIPAAKAYWWGTTYCGRGSVDPVMGRTAFGHITASPDRVTCKRCTLAALQYAAEGVE